MKLALPLLIAIAAPVLGEDAKAIDLGDPAPDFDLPAVDGKRYSLKSFADAKIVAVVFTCNHCPTAQAYEGRIKKLVKDYKSRGVAVVAISPNDDKAVRLDELGYSDLGDSLEDMKLRAKAEAFNFPYLYDGDTQSTALSYGAAKTPHVFILDGQRKLRYRGAIDDDESGKRIRNHHMRNALEALLAGKAMPKADTRSFGCTIKWSSKRAANKVFLDKLAKEKVEVKKIGVAAVKKLRANKTENYRLVNVWATWCAPCVKELPDFVTMNRMYRGRNFEFCTISLDQPKTEKLVLETLKKLQASNENYIYDGDSRDDFADALYGRWTGTLPFTVLIAPGGKVVYNHEGEIDPLDMKREIVKRLGRTYH